jgi:3-hydroxy acid dehydrogenase / malonic semialdehyde reductase
MNSAELGTVFVTGASNGFGAVIARRSAAAGARVVATARRAERLKGLAAELGPLVLPVMLDVRDRAAVTEVVGGLAPEFAEIDVLVNNAGLALGLNPAQDAGRRPGRLGADDRHQLQGPGLLHPGYPARHSGPRPRHVINLGSVAAAYPYPDGNAYGGTKALEQHIILVLTRAAAGAGRPAPRVIVTVPVRV